MKIIQNYIITILSILAFILLFKSSEEQIFESLKDYSSLFTQFQIGNSIYFNLSIGWIISVIFWIIIVKIPDINKRNIYKNNLKIYYLDFKIKIIEILLSNNKANNITEDKLLNYNEFKKYFSKNNYEQWYSAINNIENNQYLWEEFISEIDLFLIEIDYILNNIDFNDKEILLFFKDLKRNLYSLKNSSNRDYEQMKILFRFIWSFLSGFNMNDGYTKEDIINKMISKI